MAGLIDVGIIKPELTDAFGAGYRGAEEARNLLARQQQQRQIGDIELQNALRAQRLAGEEEAAYRAAGSDMNALQNELFRRGLGKQGLAVGAQMQKQQADKIAMLKGTTELMKSAATSIMANPSLQSALGTVQAFGQRTGTDVSRDIAELTQLGDNPDAIRQWAAGHAMSADKLLPQFQKFDQGGAIVTGAVNPLTGEFTQKTAYQKSMAPGEAERIGLERQRVGLEGQRVKLAQEESQLRREGIEGISPKELQKREAVFPQATSAVKGFETKSDSFIKDLKALRNDPGLEQITGPIYGRTPSVSREGSRAQALYDKVMAKGGFQALQDLRDASKTGGALGNVSNQEGKQLTASFAAIDRRQNAADVRAAIDQAIADIEGSKTRMREAYDETYKYKSERRGAGPAAPAPDPLGIR